MTGPQKLEQLLRSLRAVDTAPDVGESWPAADAIGEWMIERIRARDNMGIAELLRDLWLSGVPDSVRRAARTRWAARLVAQLGEAEGERTTARLMDEGEDHVEAGESLAEQWKFVEAEARFRQGLPLVLEGLVRTMAFARPLAETRAYYLLASACAGIESERPTAALWAAAARSLREEVRSGAQALLPEGFVGPTVVISLDDWRSPEAVSPSSADENTWVIVDRAASDLREPDTSARIAHLDFVPAPAPVGVQGALLAWRGVSLRVGGTVLVRLLIDDPGEAPADVVIDGVRFAPVSAEVVDPWSCMPSLHSGHWYQAKGEFDWTVLKERAGRLSIGLGGAEGLSPSAIGLNEPVEALGQALEAARESNWIGFVARLVESANLLGKDTKVPPAYCWLAAHYLNEIRRVMPPEFWMREVLPHRGKLAHIGWLSAVFHAG
jgi:hypothetical protein